MDRIAQRTVAACALLLACLPAAAQQVTLQCDVASPRYRSSLYGTMMTLEGSFRVRLGLPEGIEAVTLVGSVTEPGAAEGPGRTLTGATAGEYHLPFILKQYSPGRLLLQVRAMDGNAVVAEATAAVTVMPRAPHEVTLDDRGALLAQGVPVLPIGYSGEIPPRVGALADAGFGLLLTEGAVGLDPRQMWDPRVLAVVQAPADERALQGNATSGAIGAWLAGSEWRASDLAAAEPYHPIVARPAQGEADGDIVLVEIDGTSPREAVGALANRIGLDEAARPHWVLLPSPQTVPGERLGALAFGCALAGARGVVFRSEGLSPSGLSAALGNCLPRLNLLAPLLLAPYAPRSASVDEAGVVAALKRARFDDTLLLTNLTGEAITATCRGLGPEDGIDMETGQVLFGSPGGVLSVPLDPWATRCLQLRLRDEGADE